MNLSKLLVTGLLVLGASSYAATSTVDARTTSWKGTVEKDVGREDGKSGKDADETKAFSYNGTVADFFGSNEHWTFNGNTYTWDDGAVKITATEIPADSVKTPGYAVPKDATNVKVYGNPKCEKSAKYSGKEDPCATVHPSLTWTFYTTAKGEPVYRMDRLNKKDATKGRNLVIVGKVTK